LYLIEHSFVRFGHVCSLGDVAVYRVWCARRVGTTALIVDTQIVLRVLIVIFSSDSVITPRRLLCKCEVALVYLPSASSDALAGTMAVERLIALWSSRLLLGWPVCIEAAARSLI
jgi:hypothetical protein